MKKLALIACIALTGCHAPKNYAPPLQAPIKAKEKAKFQGDLEECRKGAKPTDAETASLMVFGGLADVVMVAGGNKRMIESESARIDDCMRDKGYKLKKDE